LEFIMRLHHEICNVKWYPIIRCAILSWIGDAICWDCWHWAPKISISTTLCSQIFSTHCWHQLYLFSMAYVRYNILICFTSFFFLAFGWSLFLISVSVLTIFLCYIWYCLDILTWERKKTTDAKRKFYKGMGLFV
jgi:hypothetical protein